MLNNISSVDKKMTDIKDLPESVLDEVFDIINQIKSEGKWDRFKKGKKIFFFKDKKIMIYYIRKIDKDKDSIFFVKTLENEKTLIINLPYREKKKNRKGRKIKEVENLDILEVEYDINVDDRISKNILELLVNK